MADRRAVLGRLSAAFGAARQIWLGATGGHAYEAYRRHRLAAHPGEPVPGRAEFEARIASRRYDGVSRCC